MKALCWKELRENWRWALLAAVGLGGAQWYALNQGEERYSLGYNWSNDGLLLNHATFLAVTSFGCALAGLLLGLVQILPELRRDQWASLLHRPVGRGTVFRGKVVGGLLLYASATVPPFLYSVWRVATPGHFAAPFVPETVLAGTADVCTGAVFYFAALAAALPRGVWFGVRVFPLLAAVHAMLFVQHVELFRVAVEAAVAMSLGLAAAGWATLLQQDRLAGRPWIGRVACLVVAFYGVCGVGDLARLVYEAIGPARHSRMSRYSLSDTGLPLRLTYVDNVVTSVTDSEGHPTEDKRFGTDQVRSHLRYTNRFSRYIGDPHSWQRPVYRSGYRETRRYLTINRAYPFPRPEQWFYLDERRVYIAYSPVTKLPLEQLDRHGFTPLDRPAEPFGEETLHNQLGDDLIEYDPNDARFVDLPHRRVTDLALSGPVYGSSTAYASVGGSSVSVFGFALADRLAVYDAHGAPVTALPYHQDVSRWGELSLGMTGDKERFYLKYDPSAWLPEFVRAGMPAFLEVTDGQGKLLQTYTLPPLAPEWRSRSWPEYVADRLQSPAFFVGGILYQKIGALFGSKRLADQLAWRLGHERERTRQAAVFISVFSLSLAAGTWVWARQVRFAPGRTLAWTVFVLVGGLAGFVAFRATVDWPRFVPCFRCRRLRPLDEESCPACGAGWPAAPAEGTEIFDREAATVLAGVRL